MKEEKIGMYNIDEIYEVLTENVEGSFLNRSMVDAMIFKIKDLQSQLKAKEETINKAIKHVSSLSSRGRGCEIYADVKRDILEILSKGENK